MKNNKIVYSQWTFEGDDIKDGNMFMATSLLSSQLQVNTFEATVKCTNPSILNFERNAKLTYYYDGMQRGIFHVQDIERAGPDTYRISATSTLGLLTEGKHYGGIYTGQTAQEIISSICGSVPFIIKNNLAGTKLYGWLPIAAPRDNLSQVLFAIGAALKTDLDGVLRIAGLWDGVSGSVGKDEMYQGGKVEYTAKVTQVVLTEHQYSEGGDTKKLFDGTPQAGDIITFSGPMYALSASGFSIQASGANWAKVSGGAGTLTGREYIHNTRLITRNVHTANIPNVKTVDKATLISLVNSSAVADRLSAFYKCTQTIDAPVIYRGENTGNVLSVYHPYDKSSVSSCLQSADITLSGTLKAQEKSLVGFVPQQFSNEEVTSMRELLTGSGTWTVPEGVTSVRAVLIGGGSGGYSGSSGGSTAPDSSYVYDGKSSTFSISEGASKTITASKTSGVTGAGAMGSGGSGGQAGRVLQVSMDVSEGQKISYSCGGGGSPNGGSGGPTAFGSHSSSSGSSNASGYYDIVSGTTYARQGAAGGAGGAGGAAGSSGSSTSGASGGAGVSGTAYPVMKSASQDGSLGSSVDFKITSSTSFQSGPAGGGGAGGPSGSASGQPGGAAVQTSGAASIAIDTSSEKGRASATASAPGSGGSGANGRSGSNYGDGGGGGGGGGGAGGFGSASLSNSVTNKITYASSSMIGKSMAVNADLFLYLRGGSGGAGGSGGYGASGCVILYYDIHETIPAGRFVDKNGKNFLDNLARRVIV